MSGLRQMTERQTTNTRCLPADLVRVTQTCGIPCIRGWIDKNFNSPSCASTRNLNYLCTTQTSIGLTIGEGAYQCLLANCPGLNTDLFLPTYRICNDIADAVPRQQTVLTVTAATGPASTVVVPAATSSTLVASITPPVTTDTAARPPTSTGPFTSVSAATIPTAATSSNSSPRLSRAEIAGATVGSAVGAFALLLLVFLFCKGRKRSEKRKGNNSDIIKDLPTKSSAYSSRDTSPVPPVAAPNPQPAGDSATSASINAALQAATTPVTAITPTRPKLSPLQQNPHSRMRSFSQLDMKTEAVVKPKGSAELKPHPSPEHTGVAISPTQPTGFAAKATSMPTVQESPTIPIRNTQITVWSVASADSDEAPSGLAILQAKSYMPPSHTRKPSEQSEKEYSETDRIITDVEAQNDAASPNSRSSFLSSARASMAEMGAAFVTLARAVSLKRQSSSPKVPETNTKRKPIRKPTPQHYRAPTTPKYDNGNIVMDAELPPVMPDASLALVAAARSRQPNTIAVQKFQDFKYGKLPATEPGFNKESRSEAQQDQTARLLGEDSTGHSRSESSESSGNRSSSATMTPPPLTIKKKSREVVKEKATSGEVTPSRPKSSHSRNASSSSLRSQKGTATSPYIRSQASRNQLVTMGLNSPDHVQHYAQKPLPAPTGASFSTPDLKGTIPPKPSSVATLAALKTSQNDLQRPPLPQTVSAPSDPVASILSPPSSIYSEATVFTQAFSSPPRGRPGFPSSKTSQTSIPPISPGMTLAAAMYKPFRQVSEDQSFLKDSSPAGKAFAAGQMASRVAPPPPPPSKPTPPMPQLRSSPPHIAQLRSTNLPPLPPIPIGIALSSASKPAVVPELAHLVNTTGVTSSTTADQDGGRLGALLQSQSPTSADPNRNSMTPKALFTPSRTVEGDLLLHVDHSVLNK